MSDITAKLSVDTERVFIFGDVGAHLLTTAWDQCGKHSCKQPSSFQKQLDLAEHAWSMIPERSILEGKQNPCSVVNVSGGGFASSTECAKTLSSLTDCRHGCVAELFCGGSALHELAGQAWQDVDSKRGAGGFDLLPKYFIFPPDQLVEPGRNYLAGYRTPTHLRLGNAEIPACQPKESSAACSANPCGAKALALGGAECKAPAAQCFRKTADVKADRLPQDDPLANQAGKLLVRPELGWPTALGFSPTLSARVHVQLYTDRPSLQTGDHVPFVAAIHFDSLS